MASLKRPHRQLGANPWKTLGQRLPIAKGPVQIPESQGPTQDATLSQSQLSDVQQRKQQRTQQTQQQTPESQNNSRHECQDSDEELRGTPILPPDESPESVANGGMGPHESEFAGSQHGDFDNDGNNDDDFDQDVTEISGRVRKHKRPRLTQNRGSKHVDAVINPQSAAQVVANAAYNELLDRANVTARLVYLCSLNLGLKVSQPSQDGRSQERATHYHHIIKSLDPHNTMSTQNYNNLWSELHNISKNWQWSVLSKFKEHVRTMAQTQRFMTGSSAEQRKQMFSENFKNVRMEKFFTFANRLVDFEASMGRDAAHGEDASISDDALRCHTWFLNVYVWLCEACFRNAIAKDLTSEDLWAFIKAIGGPSTACMHIDPSILIRQPPQPITAPIENKKVRSPQDIMGAFTVIDPFLEDL